MLTNEEKRWAQVADENRQTRPYIPGETGFPPGAPRGLTLEQCNSLWGSAEGPRIHKTLSDNRAFLAKADGLPKEQPTGSKFDGDKPRMDLLDSDFLEEVASVLTFGAKKYAAHNWRGGIAYSRLIAAAYRHLGAINRGEDIDPESGLPHVAHLGCCVMFLSSMMRVKPELDDRYKGPSGQ